MKTIKLVRPGHYLYVRTCEFANDVYLRSLHATTREPPESFVVAEENGTICGCIGLNRTVSSDLFLNDSRYQAFRKSCAPRIKIAEQNIFAIDRFPVGVPALIAAVAAYGRLIGSDMIAFAGIGVSCKTVSSLGYDTVTLGPTPADVFSAEDLKKYAYWLEHFRPVSCILSTARAVDICAATIERFKRQVALEPELAEMLGLLQKVTEAA